MILTHFVAYSQISNDTICLSKQQAQRVVRSLDSLNQLSKALMMNQNLCDSAIQDLENELNAYKQLDSVKNSSIHDRDSVITTQGELIKKQSGIINNQTTKIKKQKRRFRLFGCASGGAIATLLLLVLL